MILPTMILPPAAPRQPGTVRGILPHAHPPRPKPCAWFAWFAVPTCPFGQCHFAKRTQLAMILPPTILPFTFRRQLAATRLVRAHTSQPAPPPFAWFAGVAVPTHPLLHVILPNEPKSFPALAAGLRVKSLLRRGARRRWGPSGSGPYQCLARLFPGRALEVAPKRAKAGQPSTFPSPTTLLREYVEDKCRLAWIPTEGKRPNMFPNSAVSLQPKTRCSDLLSNQGILTGFLSKPALSNNGVWARF
jgi:hypothetical protein